MSIVRTLILQPFLGHYLVNPKPFLRYLPNIVRRQNFIIISFVKKCTLYLIKFGTFYNKRLVDSKRSSLLIICSCDYIKHYNFLGSMDGSIYRKCQKMLIKMLGFFRQ